MYENISWHTRPGHSPKGIMACVSFSTYLTSCISTHQLPAHHCSVSCYGALLTSFLSSESKLACLSLHQDPSLHWHYQSRALSGFQHLLPKSEGCPRCDAQLEQGKQWQSHLWQKICVHLVWFKDFTLKCIVSDYMSTSRHLYRSDNKSVQ